METSSSGVRRCLPWANVIKWKGSLGSPSLFTPDLTVVVLFL